MTAVVELESAEVAFAAVLLVAVDAAFDRAVATKVMRMSGRIMVGDERGRWRGV